MACLFESHRFNIDANVSGCQLAIKVHRRKDSFCCDEMHDITKWVYNCLQVTRTIENLATEMPKSSWNS